MKRAFQKLKNIYHLLVAVVANVYYGFPSRSIKVIGITGTDGKTTTSALLHHIISKSGKKSSVLTTVSAKIGKETFDTGFHVTTPNSIQVQRFLRKAVDADDEYFIMETTSHALDQNRVFGVKYLYGVMTNISHEHLQYHVTMKDYLLTKCRLLNQSETAVINADDNSFEALKSHINSGKVVLTYGLINKADYNLDVSTVLDFPVAKFNKYNYLAAYTVAVKLGLSKNEIISAMKSFKMPEGRMEIVYSNEFSVIVDFAHTPASIREALTAVREMYGGGRLIHVFSAAAFRDDLKRPIMGRESGKVADLVILTEEDYRTEDPVKIAQGIAVGLEEEGFKSENANSFGDKNNKYTIIIDRYDAIKKAISIAKPKDVILLTGKGHERSLNRNGKEYPWSEVSNVKNIIMHSDV
ncbi:hypothetical protein COV58_01625 [Candidatus Roizmanbacteria bacterium CG11_big_fil_rev_8_21_14_0_20_36_8]|uniref:UDP-N-acetylmuramoyl-L-alanyl-D-glutamate--2, 6-diaminopimelate ligase n=2 Tax=Candidatus Roizmaniibacteriota TaxID=1752723 RepID=A0A2M6IUL4_9BACT|nr:MAG: hypothetical protein COV58_01625 [Candidatus Roizmanbacteria bacterium CG11_big_fil_rev_8_21_14_0_20_36_8]PIZ64307.1 MAG: hypothetical protein COY14_05010 [Candidatus Roizmanbacteria bacterium CG_4_10_14_0_2_um_filter_36_9]